MELLPHIDITEPARIQALLDDKGNFSWRAVDSETLDSWTPDLGLTAYPQPSVYRAGAVASSGISSTLRQRFWQTIEHQADHTGTRYIGIVIYLAAGETAPMELRLASQEIGRVEPVNHDNRLHLIVVDKAVEFIGEMEIFQLTAPGAGRYRIEHFVLLHERPEASGSPPAIGDISLRLQSSEDDAFTAHLHFVTSRVASVQARIKDDSSGGEILQQGDATRLHHLVCTGLPADRDFEAVISAIDSAGGHADERMRFATAAPPSSSLPEMVVPLELLNPYPADVSGLPLTFGLPLAKGALPRIASCELHAGGETIAAQARPMSRWHDGSIRWALVESRVPQALAESNSVAASLQIDSASAQTSQADGSADGGARLSFIDATPQIAVGGEQRLSLSDLRFEGKLANGVLLNASEIRSKASHASDELSLTVEHRDADGVAHLRSNMRLQFYSNQSFVKLQHRLEVISPALAPAAAGGDIPPECSDDMRENIVGDSGEVSNLLKLRSFSLRLPIEGARKVHHVGQPFAVDDDGWQLRHDHDLAHEIKGEVREGRAPGHIRVDGDSGTMGIGLRNFWRTYPKALTVGSDGIDIGLLPERVGRDLPGDEDAAHRLYFWLDEGGYKLKAGMALSSEILIDFGEDNPAVFDWLEKPVLVRPDIDYLNSTGALNHIGTQRDSPLPEYEALTDRAIDSFHQDREYFRAYGQVNFGDWYGESAWSWGNNEYDPSYCAYTEFLRGGDPRWALWAAEAARHLADVDTVNHSSDPAEIGGQSMHMPGHLGGYLPPYFRSKMAGTKSIPSHTWVEGPLLHYLLSGDETVYNSLLKTKDWLLQRRFFDYYDFSNAREAGWHLIHLCALADSLDDTDCLNAASIIVERVLERQEPEGGWVRNLGEPHCGCGYPRCRGEAGFMVGVLLSGLKRYHHLTGSEAVAEAIIGGARWLIRETFDEASGHFRYTSCPNRTLGGNFQLTQYVLEALASAWELSGDAEIGRYLGAGLPTIGMFPAGLDHLGTGKALSQQMRYVPSIIAALKKRPLEENHD